MEIILKQPLVQLHDDDGRLISNERIPLVIIQDKLEEWGRAYNKYLNEQ